MLRNSAAVRSVRPRRAVGRWDTRAPEQLRNRAISEGATARTCDACPGASASSVANPYWGAARPHCQSCAAPDPAHASPFLMIHGQASSLSRTTLHVMITPCGHTHRHSRTFMHAAVYMHAVHGWHAYDTVVQHAKAVSAARACRFANIVRSHRVWCSVCCVSPDTWGTILVGLETARKGTVGRRRLRSREVGVGQGCLHAYGATALSSESGAHLQWPSSCA